MKHKKQVLISSFALLTILLISSGKANAGPGGQISQEAFKVLSTIWGRIIIHFILFLLSPVIIYRTFKEKIAIRNTKKDLTNISRYNPAFDWKNIKSQVSVAFYQVYKAWNVQKLKLAEEYISTSLIEIQQTAYLDQWEKHGFLNRAVIKKIKSIKPVHLHYNLLNHNGDESRLVIIFCARIEDYLVDLSSHQILEGKKGFTKYETVWTFLLKNKKWILDNIEEIEYAGDYIGKKNQVPLLDGKSKNPDINIRTFQN